VEGHEKPTALLLAAGPLAKKPAREVEEKVLAAWSFPPLKPGREKREPEHGGKVERRFSTLLADLDERFDRQAPAWARLEIPPP
jgi:hypothetical protein